jgi:hypothetical protein
MTQTLRVGTKWLARWVPASSESSVSMVAFPVDAPVLRAPIHKGSKRMECLDRVDVKIVQVVLKNM